MKDTIITNISAGSITFIVDENLPEPESHVEDTLSVREIAEYNLSGSDMDDYSHMPQIFASSDSGKLYNIGQDVFYQTLLTSYAEHRPVVITPDIIWTIICQGFSRHINMDPEKYRHMLVSHEGKMGLEVRRSSEGEFTTQDWEDVIRDFAVQIEQNTQGTIASSLIADFSTTGPIEAVSSRITLMSTVKEYFEFVVVNMICGIPYITLKGTPQDWRLIRERSMELARFDLKWWISGLIPVLDEFVKTAEGNPSQKFWKSIVMTYRPEDIRGAGCIPDPDGETMVDGWFPKLFPYCKEGRTPDKLPIDVSMFPETVSVPFTYREVNSAGQLVKEIKMNITSGLIGVTEDKETYELTPKFGWYINVDDSSEDELYEKLKECDQYMGIILRIQSVPDVLKRFSHIRFLELKFIGNVVIPEWMDDIAIDIFIISGKLSSKEKSEIRKRFPNCEFD